MSTTETIISALGLLGLGSLVKSILDFFVDGRKRKSESQQQHKEPRYKAILILCHTLVNFENEKDRLIIHRPNIKTKEDLLDEVYLEWVNMTLYASDDVIKAMKIFLQNYNQENFSKTMIAMRKDLYNIRTNLGEQDLTLKN
jgi:hypothetical protein